MDPFSAYVEVIFLYRQGVGRDIGLQSRPSRNRGPEHDAIFHDESSGAGQVPENRVSYPQCRTHASGVVARKESVVHAIKMKQETPDSATCAARGEARSDTNQDNDDAESAQNA